MKFDYTVTIGVCKHYFNDVSPAHANGWCAILKGVLDSRQIKNDIKFITESLVNNNIDYPVTWTLKIDGNIIDVPIGERCVDVYAKVFSNKIRDKLSLEPVLIDINRLGEIRELMKGIMKYMVDYLRDVIADGINKADDYLEKVCKER